MKITDKWLVLIAVASLSSGVDATGKFPPADSEVVVASGTLDGQLFSSGVFHIGPFWIGVPRNTEFHRWFSQAADRKVVVTLTTNPARFGDARNARILSGTLMHGTAPNPSPGSGGLNGRLPEGDLPFVHVLYLKDELSGSLGPVTFETADLETASKFDAYDGAHVSIVIQIE